MLNHRSQRIIGPRWRDERSDFLFPV